MYLICQLEGDQGFRIETEKPAIISISVDGREIANYSGDGKIEALLNVSRFKEGMIIKTTWHRGSKEAQSSYTYKGYDWNISHKVTVTSKTAGKTKVTTVMGYLVK